MSEEILRIENVSKKYRLGMIGGTTLRDELQRKRAERKGLEDPTRKVNDTSVKNIGEEFLALDGINLSINKGERVGIIGHNGAGKSTLLKLISRITAPTSGTIEMNGRVASMLEVGTGFHPELSGHENIYMNGAILGMTKAEIDKKIEDIIEFSECRQFIDTPVKRYSSGMYVKLAFSVAAHLDSEIMIMDEVLAVGDMAFQKKCLDKMSQVSHEDGRTILYVSHNMNTIRQLCDRVIVLSHGKIVYDGNVEKGISIYLSNSVDEGSVHIEYDEEQHFGNQCTYDAVIKSIDILDKSVPIFTEDEQIKLSILYDSMSNLKDVRVRLTFRTQMDESVATSWSTPIELQQAYNQTVTLEMPAKSIPKGVFYPGIGFYQIERSGQFVMIDHINRAFKIEINQKAEADNIIWSPSYWGYVKLPEMKVLQ